MKGENYLAHHGIKGQKWGVRRFQNPDGTLTAAGKGRYDTDGTSTSATDATPKIGKSIKEIDKKMVKSMNPDKDYMNCAYTSSGYLMNSLFGKNVKAKPFNENLSISLKGQGTSKDAFDKIFDGLKTTECNPNAKYVRELPTIKKAMTNIPNGSTGILFINSAFGGHYINYEKDPNGKTTYVDCQSGKVYKNDRAFTSCGWRANSIYDASEATISNTPEARAIMDDIFKN